MKSDYLIEVDSYQRCKNLQKIAGDTFLSKRTGKEGRIISVLSDGLGSGVKASVLSTLTATMAMNFVRESRDIKKSAGIIMDTLPVCSKRKVSYSTFSIADIDEMGTAGIVEYENPGFILVRNSKVVKVEGRKVECNGAASRPYNLQFTKFKIEPGDRLIFFTDGVTQAGMGGLNHPLGWGWERNNVEEFVEKVVSEEPDISAGKLSKKVVNRAYFYDHYSAADDITCGVIYYRKPRKLILVTGPPVEQDRDRGLAEKVRDFDGSKVVCGGTTARIVARELDRKIELDIGKLDPEVPPGADIEGIDLVCEGIMTLNRTAEILESSTPFKEFRENRARKLAEILTESDYIKVILGTRINEAHQDTNVPLEMGIRRNIVYRIIRILEEKYLKRVEVDLI